MPQIPKKKAFDGSTWARNTYGGSERSQRGFWPRARLLSNHPTYFSVSSNFLKNYIHTMPPHSYLLSHPKITLPKDISGFSMLSNPKTTLSPFCLYTSQKHLILSNTLSCTSSPHSSSRISHRPGFLHFLKR